MSRKRTIRTASAAVLDDESSVGTQTKRPAARDWGVAGRRGAEVEDRELRRAYPGLPLRSAYSRIVGDIPELSAGDVTGAARVLDRIQSAIDKGGWTTNEWSRLYRMREVWRHRASGKDRRFQLVGNRKTGITRRELDRILFEECAEQLREFIWGLINGGEKGGRSSEEL